MKRRRWKKLKPLPGRNNPCLNCPPIEATLPMSARIAVGFGYAALVKDGAHVWTEDPRGEWVDALTVRNAERRARRDPDHDWRIVLHGPMHGETYQRQGPSRWVLVEKNQGFA